MMREKDQITWQHIANDPHHILTLAQWFDHEWHHYNPAVTVETRIQELKGKKDNGSLPLTMIALEAETLLGTYSLDLDDLPIRSHLTPWLASVFVNPKFRGQHVGKRLVIESMAHAKRLGIKTLYLFTKNTLAPWYANMGWQTVEQLCYKGDDITIMQVQL